MKLKNLPELKNKLKTFLPEYLKQKGIKIERNKLQCPNHSAAHEHGDLKKLSAAFLPQSNNTLVYCFVEDRKFDIFDCYAILEDKKITGQGFYDCIKTLCKTFEIPYEEDEEYSMKDIELRNKQKLLQQLHSISLKNIQQGVEYYKKRGLTKDKIKHWKIGFITPNLITRAIDIEFKKHFPYSLTSVFDHPALLIPILNECQQYVGLILRQFGCDKSDNYLNISIEGKNLFNMQSIKGEEYIYITEGVFDTISLYPETNVVSILTNSIHDKDLEQLTKHNYKKIFLALDADNLYQGKARDGILKSILKLKNVDTSINVVILPTGADPDSFVKEQGLEAFKNLPKMSAIKYLLTNFQKELIKIEKIYEFVSGSPSLIRKEKLISVVAKTLDIGKKQITKEISKLEDKESNYNIVTYVQEKESLCELLSDFTDMAWNKSFKGIQTGYPLFDKYCGGFEDTIYTMVGFPEQGKTSTILNFAWQLMLNPKNYVAFYSLDDGAKRSIVPRFMSMATNMPSKAMKEPNEGIKDIWNGGMKTLLDLKDNYTIKDGADIRTVADLDEFIKIHFNIAQENNKKFIVIIDNLHSLTSSYKYQSVEDTKRVATYLKRIPQQYFCPIITTAEVPKSADKKPTGKDIKESIDIWYASRFVAGIRSDFHDKPDSNLIWRDAETDKMYPIIELYVSKNQTGECWHGSLYYKFSFATNKFVECTEQEMEILKKGDYLF